jgi:hypothetical protein
MNHPQTIRRLTRSILVGVLALILTVGSSRSVHALEALRPSLKELSEKIAGLLKGRKEGAITVGAFTGPSRFPSSSGPGIKQILIEELQKQKIDGKPIQVSKEAKLEVKGDYLGIQDKDSKLLALRLLAKVLDGQGDVVVNLDKTIEDPDVLAQVLGIPKPDFGAGLTREKESEALKKRLDNPQTELRGTRIQTDPKSSYAIEILVKSGTQYEPVAPEKDGGQAFVAIKPGQVFAVRLINDSDFDAAAELRLDGLSVFVFSDHPEYRHFIVAKKSSALIKGWHRTNRVSDEFLITGYAKTAVAELLANPDDIGTITVSFAAAWKPKEKAPEDESAKFKDPFGVGRGNPVVTPYEEVTRETGRIRDIIPVRYKKRTP